MVRTRAVAFNFVRAAITSCFVAGCALDLEVREDTVANPEGSMSSYSVTCDRTQEWIDQTQFRYTCGSCGQNLQTVQNVERHCTACGCGSWTILDQFCSHC